MRHVQPAAHGAPALVRDTGVAHGADLGVELGDEAAVVEQLRDGLRVGGGDASRS
jgi:hypothetical protein